MDDVTHFTNDRKCVTTDCIYWPKLSRQHSNTSQPANKLFSREFFAREMTRWWRRPKSLKLYLFKLLFVVGCSSGERLPSEITTHQLNITLYRKSQNSKSLFHFLSYKTSFSKFDVKKKTSFSSSIYKKSQKKKKINSHFGVARKNI